MSKVEQYLSPPPNTQSLAKIEIASELKQTTLDKLAYVSDLKKEEIEIGRAHV